MMHFVTLIGTLSALLRHRVGQGSGVVTSQLILSLLFSHFACGQTPSDFPKVRQSIFRIITTFEYELAGGGRRTFEKTGTGFAISRYGKVLTAKHVIDEKLSSGTITNIVPGTRSIRIYREGETRPFAIAEDFYRDQNRDIALLRLRDLNHPGTAVRLEPLCLGASGRVEARSLANSLTNSAWLTVLGFRTPEIDLANRSTRLDSLVSERDTHHPLRDANVWRVQSEIPAGFSGGPFLDIEMRVVAMGTHSYVAHLGPPTSLAIPAEIIKDVVRAHIDDDACAPYETAPQQRSSTVAARLTEAELHTICHDAKSINNVAIIELLVEALHGASARVCIVERRFDLSRGVDGFSDEIQRIVVSAHQARRTAELNYCATIAALHQIRAKPDSAAAQGDQAARFKEVKLALQQAIECMETNVGSRSGQGK